MVRQLPLHLLSVTRINHHPLPSVLRGDIARLERCTAITTGADLAPLKGDAEDDDDALAAVLPRTIKRSKPFKYTYEKEIVMYAYFKVRLFYPFLGFGGRVGHAVRFGMLIALHSRLDLHRNSTTTRRNVSIAQRRIGVMRGRW